MTPKIFFTIEAIVCLLFGISLVFLPDHTGELYLTDPSLANGASDLIGQGYGSLLIALAVAFWSARDARLTIGRRSLLMVITLSNLFVIIIHIMAITSKLETSSAWGIVALGVFSFIFGALLLTKEKVTD